MGGHNAKETFFQILILGCVIFLLSIAIKGLIPRSTGSVQSDGVLTPEPHGVTMPSPSVYQTACCPTRSYDKNGATGTPYPPPQMNVNVPTYPPYIPPQVEVPAAPIFTTPVPPLPTPELRDANDGHILSPSEVAAMTTENYINSQIASAPTPDPRLKPTQASFPVASVSDLPEVVYHDPFFGSDETGFGECVKPKILDQRH